MNRAERIANLNIPTLGSDIDIESIYVRVYRLIGIFNRAYARGDIRFALECKYLLDGHYATIQRYHMETLPDSSWNTHVVRMEMPS